MCEVVNWKSKEMFRDIVSAVVLFLFLYTGVSKLLDFERFRDVLGTSPLLKHYAVLIAWSLPITEIILAILLFIPATRLNGLYGSLGIMLVFTVYLAWMVRFAEHLPCNCGGVISKLSWNQHIVFNLVVIILIIAGIICYGKRVNILDRSPP